MPKFNFEQFTTPNNKVVDLECDVRICLGRNHGTIKSYSGPSVNIYLANRAISAYPIKEGMAMMFAFNNDVTDKNSRDYKRYMSFNFVPIGERKRTRGVCKVERVPGTDIFFVQYQGKRCEEVVEFMNHQDSVDYKLFRDEEDSTCYFIDKRKPWDKSKDYGSWRCR